MSNPNLATRLSGSSSTPTSFSKFNTRCRDGLRKSASIKRILYSQLGEFRRDRDNATVDFPSDGRGARDQERSRRATEEENRIAVLNQP